ncbi:MAG: hypothetical protein JXR48_15385 [Candidatus Delongbacteria bacterium]|nr:hypothetical protein [Candidatus Delongbacteria bacterium]MBN2836338.1 hypothetical protein [Candidatus Delongbacteria bacterium]
MEEKRFKVEKDDRKICQEQISQKASTVYEAIMVIANRTRKIDNFQKRVLDKAISEIGDRGDMPYVEDLKANLPKFDKAERIAVHEYLDETVDYKYNSDLDFER